MGVGLGRARSGWVGLEGVVLADDPPPAPTAVIARSDGAKEEDDDEHEKQKFEHEGNLPLPGLIKSSKSWFLAHRARVVRAHG